METATLLFGCITGEAEVLRPRAVAALDALLAAYCRRVAYTTTAQAKALSNEPTNPTAAIGGNNPWGTFTPSSTLEANTSSNSNSNNTNINSTDGLAKKLLPLLWRAAQHSQPKQSRVAAARWASELLMQLDLTHACHLLCFLAGDTDVTAASIARDALNAGKIVSNEQEDIPKPLADFGELVGVLLTADDGGGRSSSSWRPNYWEFTPKGRAVAVEYLLQCLLQDIYGGDNDDESMTKYVAALATSIVDSTSEARRHEYLVLLDECAEALSLCLSTSSLARSLVASQTVGLGPDSIRDLALSCHSSKARRLLAECWGHLQKDTTLWQEDVWAEKVEATLRTCGDRMEQLGSSAGSKHGAAFLAGTCIQVYRQHPSIQRSTSWAELVST